MIRPNYFELLLAGGEVCVADDGLGEFTLGTCFAGSEDWDVDNRSGQSSYFAIAKCVVVLVRVITGLSMEK